MKGSKELIEHYNKREEELGEKATKLNMYLEGYAEGYRDTKALDVDKAKEAFNKTCGWLSVYPWYNGVFEEFVKALED